MSSSATSVQVQMPQMGISVSEGTILEWRKAVGDEVAADEPIADVTTDKVDVEIPCPASGVLAKIVAEPGDTVPVGEVIAEIDVGGASAEGPDDSEGSASGSDGSAAGPDGAEGSPASLESGAVETPSTPPPAEVASPTASSPAGAGSGERAGFVSPVVRRMAEEHGIDLSQVEGHGVGGRIRKKDLLAHIESAPKEKPSRPMHIESPYVPEPAPAPVTGNGHAPAELGGRREAMTPMRKAIAEHMLRSRQTAAHVTTVVEVDFSAVADRRAKLKETLASRGVPLTYLAFVARATVEALAEFPILNASIEGDEVVYHDDVNLGIAVALDDGLIVPVIPRAQRLSLEGTAAAIADVAERARTRKLEPDEVQGGTFTITNPGQFGAVIATPIINQPQVGILDLEAIVKRPVVVTTPVATADAERSSRGDVSDAIAIRPMGFLPLSFDHRALDGATAARFLARVKELLEGGDVR
jgi:pyruvate dehydrogenase E2 component (dihydrolipoamide acetyltransferase)